MARYTVRTIRTDPAGYLVSEEEHVMWQSPDPGLNVPLNIPTDLNVNEKITLEGTKTQK